MKALLMEKVFSRIKEEVGEELYEVWFAPLRIAEMDNHTIVLNVPDGFFTDWFSKHYLPVLLKKFRDETGKTYDVKIVVEENRSYGIEQEKMVKGKKNHGVALNLIPRYTFENFVVGKSNEFAYSACFAVSNEPGTVYNPLYVYGSVGLGKTHLLNAIGHRIRELHSHFNILYISAESFMNEFLKAMRTKTMEQFRKKFRNTFDLFLVDDVQFLSGNKESTQEEFFHTFNALFNLNKQIVLTSDRPPKDIEQLQERLRSRFEMGLVVEIQPPELETKIAILKKKAENYSVSISDEIAFYIAERVHSNIRKLEGALLRIKAFASMRSSHITFDLAKEALKELLEERKTKADPDAVIREVARIFNVKVSDLKSKRRFRQIALPRQVAMFILRNSLGMSLPEIGNLLGGKDHTTVLHSVKKIEIQINKDEYIRSTVENIRKKMFL